MLMVRRLGMLAVALFVAPALLLAGVALSGYLAPLGLMTAPGPRVTVVARPGTASADMQAAVLRAARRDLAAHSDFYNYRYSGPATVVLAATPEEFLALAGGTAPGDAIGFADSSRRLIAVSPASWRDDPGLLGGVLAEETSHLVFEQKFAAAGKTPPRWLDEGLSNYVSNGWALANVWVNEQPNAIVRSRYAAATWWQLATNSLQQDIVAAAGAAAGRLVPMQRMDTLFEGNASDVRLAYAASYDFVNYLAQTYGVAELRGFIDTAAAPNTTVDRAASRVFGTGLGALQAGWRRSLTGGGWLVGRGRATILGVLAVVAALGLILILVRRNLGRNAARLHDHAPGEEGLGLHWEDAGGRPHSIDPRKRSETVGEKPKAGAPTDEAVSRKARGRRSA